MNKRLWINYKDKSKSAEETSILAQLDKAPNVESIPADVEIIDVSGGARNVSVHSVPVMRQAGSTLLTCSSCQSC